LFDYCVKNATAVFKKNEEKAVSANKSYDGKDPLDLLEELLF